MKSFWAYGVLAAICGLSLLSSCNKKNTWLEKDQVYATTLPNIRLGDGVPLNLRVSTRWTIDNAEVFFKQFESPAAFDTLILRPRQTSIASEVSNKFESVDSVFSVDRQRYMETIRKNLLEKAGESGVTIKEVILSEVVFPPRYAQAREEIGTKNQEMAHIKHKSEVDLASAGAAKLKAEADGMVAIEEAKQAGELARINSESERFRRMNEVAIAETAKQVAEAEAIAEAKKLELIANTEVKKARDMKNVEIEKMRDIDNLQFEKDKQVASLCISNPTYANYMVNKELASKVQIAVLPAGADGSMFGDLLKNGMGQKGR